MNNCNKMIIMHLSTLLMTSELRWVAIGNWTTETQWLYGTTSQLNLWPHRCLTSGNWKLNNNKKMIILSLPTLLTTTDVWWVATEKLSKWNKIMAPIDHQHWPSAIDHYHWPSTIHHRPLTVDHWPSTIHHPIKIHHRTSNFTIDTIDHKPSKLTINHWSLIIGHQPWTIKIDHW